MGNPLEIDAWYCRLGGRAKARNDGCMLIMGNVSWKPQLKIGDVGAIHKITMGETWKKHHRPKRETAEISSYFGYRDIGGRWSSSFG